MNQIQDIIEFTILQKSKHQQRNSAGLVGEVGSCQPKYQNPPPIRFILPSKIKKMMTLNNRSMQINILEINRKSITTLLNKFPYLSDIWHLKSRYVHVATEELKTEYES